MIQKVSSFNKYNFGFGSNPEQKSVEQNVKTSRSRVGRYADSFVKQSTKSAPVLAGLAGAWSIIDKVSQDIPLSQALKQNLTRFFIPVLVVSSAILAGIETKNRENR